ncbi:MAG TPA: FkbM family methyltransferase [Pseudonocardiaceae bacterium]
MTSAELRLVDLGDGLRCHVPAAGVDEARFIHGEVFQDNCYLREGINLSASAVVLDIGANIGLFTLYVKRHRPSARVLAVEPMPVTFQALRANLRRHGCVGVTALRAALGARSEHAVPFAYYPDHPGNATRYPAQKAKARALLMGRPGTARENAYRARLLADPEQVLLSVRRLSDVLASVGLHEVIDLVKIDVEGAEADVLAGIGDADWRRIRQVVVEVQDLDDAPSTVPSVLAEHGFTVTSVPSGGVLGVLGTETVFARRP